MRQTDRKQRSASEFCAAARAPWLLPFQTIMKVDRQRRTNRVSDHPHEPPHESCGGFEIGDAGPRNRNRHIGGAASRPTMIRAACSVPSSFFSAAGMKTLAPGLSSLLSPGVKATMVVCGTTVTVFSPP